MNLLLEIITPEKVVLKDEVDEIIVPTVTGEIAILPNHAELLTKINPGELIIRKNGKDQSFAILGGFLEVINNRISILADYAIRADDIEIAKVQEAQERAKQKMKQKDTEQDFRVAEAELRKSLLQLKVARKHKARYST
jgi:F-type H+-transporting ATPase subunit epsilon